DAPATWLLLLPVLDHGGLGLGVLLERHLVGVGAALDLAGLGDVLAVLAVYLDADRVRALRQRVALVVLAVPDDLVLARPARCPRHRPHQGRVVPRDLPPVGQGAEVLRAVAPDGDGADRLAPGVLQPHRHIRPANPEALDHRQLDADRHLVAFRPG